MNQTLHIDMDPAPGSSRVAYVGDRLTVRVRASGTDARSSLRCFLRCNLIHDGTHRGRLPLWERTARWQDLPMLADGDGWRIDVPLLHCGWYQAKAMVMDSDGVRHWAEGDDLGVSVHPSSWRSGNTIYCAFPRMHGASRFQRSTVESLRDEQLTVMDKHGWTVIPPSGTLRDLTGQIPHIVDRLGCRILHLLPINPTPTTHARYGRFGSPYAATDFTAIDPALVVHDRRSTALDQFQELVDAVHGHGARLILDLAINHTGWNSTLQNEHPEWFKRDADGAFHSPGAWGTVWEDLSELDHSKPALWEHLAEVFCTWCQRGVDGFRCDAGYMVPLPAWRLITDRVRKCFPDTLFLLEGLGGGWQDTANLLQSGGMQWAYSELFQNFAPHEVGAYLDHCINSGRQVGILVHYSETHDNARLAAKYADREQARRWSLLRNRLSALTSVGGAFGFTAGVEWLADEKLNVHNSRGLNWDSDDNIVDELRRLNDLLDDHPCFFEDSVLTRISPVDQVVYALRRHAADGSDMVVVVNLDMDRAQTWVIPSAYTHLCYDLLDGVGERAQGLSADGLKLRLEPGQVCCLAAEAWTADGHGTRHRQRQCRAAVAMQAIAKQLTLADIGPGDPLAIGDCLGADPLAFAAGIALLSASEARSDLLSAVRHAMTSTAYPAVSQWQAEDQPRITVIPTHHWLVVRHPGNFRLHLRLNQGDYFATAVRCDDGSHVVLVPPQARGEGLLQLHCQHSNQQCAGQLRYSDCSSWPGSSTTTGMTLLTNGCGAMARMAIDLGAIASKYDAALAVNLHPRWPVDRHVLIKRIRAWVDADGFLSPLTAQSLRSFDNDAHSSHWHFRVGCGGGRTIDVHLQAWLEPGANTLHCRWWQDSTASVAQLELIMRPDLEDRSFHGETQRNKDTETHFRSHTSHHDDGCTFSPHAERTLRIRSSAAGWHADEEWSQCQHPIEAERGQTDHGDAWSPGYFRCRLDAQSITVTCCCGTVENAMPAAQAPQLPQPASGLEERLRSAITAYLVRRDDGKTVIAGYPWFLDWGRDTLICARGYCASGQHQAVLDLLTVFGRFEEQGTLPNIIHGDDVGNRDTVDAPLWYGVVAEELAAAMGDSVFERELGDGRSIGDCLHSIACGYLNGAANGVCVDPESALVWSPSHFTWMDTNYPAGTPRKGYPLEIQALWIRLLRLCDRLQLPAPQQGPWAALAERACDHLDRLFWLPKHGWWADCLIAERGIAAVGAVRDSALRSNAALPIALGVLTGAHARSTLMHMAKHMVVPGALRSLAPLRVDPGLPVRDSTGALLNDPHFPYQGHYQGEEDRQRKPAYHNGTAWTWTFPGFCEALVTAWPDDPQARKAALCYLSSIDELLERGCRGHLPEIVDGNAPHRHRGCDAQAWGASEALRVLLLLGGGDQPPG